MKRNILVLAVVLVFVGISIYNHIQAQEELIEMPSDTAPKVDHWAPSFELEAMDGEVYKVGGEKDKPILLNFWASWCGPCELEAPDFKKLFEQYGDEMDLYAVNLTQTDRMANIEEFVGRHQLPFPILLDKDGQIKDLYQVHFIPSTYLIDRHGIVIDIFHTLELKELEKRVKRLIRR
ncbi:TlpA family protein disulfide reductase [Paenibacillus senegalensis]|uniref:TlpA family protein disulfide reductase n=1 Tax=Paenibacillus senegalensis TaxID=1465766 RepID=UPI000288DAAC|nr:TlpA disulfide reductase family protein [Paenibacillus senegalensis]